MTPSQYSEDIETFRQVLGIPDPKHSIPVSNLIMGLNEEQEGHGDRVVTLSPPTSEAGVRSPSRPYVGKLVVACRWSAVYSTEP